MKQSPDSIPLLFDTDIGNDIDDAVALAYLLRQSRCELLGVTTATGNTIQRAALAHSLCDAAGRTDVPVLAGSPGPLLMGPGQPTVPQYEAICDRPHRLDFEPGAAVGFLRETIRARPGEITLLAVGPMTNLGLLFATDPEIPSLLRALVLMCGIFTQGAGPGAREWNAKVDPVATSLVYRARPPRHVSFGLDVTRRVVMPVEDCRRRFKEAGGPLGVTADLAAVWARGGKQITFHDPLAAAAIFEPDLCRYAEGEVRVETASEALAGLTEWRPGSEVQPHTIAVEVDTERFFGHYFDVTAGSH